MVTSRMGMWVCHVILLWVVIMKVVMASASLCVVSKWSDWSPCLGNCDFGQKVRNRDVQRPPFPEKRKGEVVIHECPPLYEVEFCMPDYCNDEDGPFQYVHKKNASPIKIENIKKIPATISNPPPPPAHKPHPKAEELPIKPRAKAVKTFPIDKKSSPRPPGCRRIPRTTCPNKPTKPRFVIRWYRMPDEPFCRTYHYAWCSQDIEDREGIIETELDCQEICFNQEEKIILPQFRIL